MPEEFDELLEDCGLDELYSEYRHMEAVIPTEPRPPHPGKEELEFLPDSSEFLAQTIDDIGYREKINAAFQEAKRRTSKHD